MAKAKKEAEVSLVSDNPQVKKPRLTKMIIKNYRCIGATPVHVELNDIVVLVGANNVGKSTILKAYELAMSQGSSKANLKLEDFPNSKVDPDNLPEIEIHTIVYDNSPGQKWLEVGENGESLVKERWIWNDAGAPTREGWDVEQQVWSTNVPWGAPNVANSRRPEPNKVDAFDPPEKQADAIKSLLMKAITDRAANFKSKEPAEGEVENEYQKLLRQVSEVQRKIVSEVQGEIEAVNDELTKLISKVFPGYVVDFDAKAEDNVDSVINLFKSGAELLMGPADGYLSTIDRQGSGARRTLLWTALKFISENNQKKKGNLESSRPQLLLIDEPEICLHPSAIREACKLLYELPTSGNWQVMVTTHSPVFIDFSRDNTTIVKVERNSSGTIEGTTVFRPDKVNLEESDKQNLKLLNICDPYVAEFFFGGKVIVVEGDTEFTAFNYIRKEKPEKYQDVHIIRARGKATIVSLVKILNHFGTPYSVLHDSDTPLTKCGTRKNPAWTNNERILSGINNRPQGIAVKLLASVPNFEAAYFGIEATGEKPYNALTTIASDTKIFATVEKLLDSLIYHGSESPINCLEWRDIGDLKTYLEKITTNN